MSGCMLNAFDVSSSRRTSSTVKVSILAATEWLKRNRRERILPGMAISFISADTDAHFRLIERRHHLRLDRERIAGFEPTDLGVPARDPGGGVKGKRKSKKDKLRELKDAAARKA